MKKTLALVVILLFYSICLSQDYSHDELSDKLKSSLKLKQTGQGLTGLGVMLGVGGFSLMLAGATEFNDYDKDAGTYKIGYLCMVGGVATITTGITLWIVGEVNNSRYKRLLSNSDMKLSLVAKKQGIGLQLTF